MNAANAFLHIWTLNARAKKVNLHSKSSFHSLFLVFQRELACHETQEGIWWYGTQIVENVGDSWIDNTHTHQGWILYIFFDGPWKETLEIFHSPGLHIGLTTPLKFILYLLLFRFHSLS